MIIYLPELYPDELVYSWFCRYAVHSGYMAHRQVLRDLYCKKSDTPVKEFIGNLNLQARVCIDKMYPLKDLVLNHTMYPQYARFIPLKQKKDALYKLCYENCDAHRLFAILPRCEKERYLKYCPVCTKEDRQRYGETYWHRKHQIRNIGICQKHKCKLRNSNVLAKNMGVYNFSAAEMVVTDSEEHIPVDNPMQIKFAEYTEQVFDAPIDFEKDIPLSAILYYSMKDTEYMKSTGKCRYMTKFVSDMTHFYEKIELNEIASVSRIQRTLLSGERYDFSLTCQIGFFLNVASEELTAPQLPEEQMRIEEKSHYIKGRTTPDWEEYDNKMSLVIKQIIPDIYNGTSDGTRKPRRITKKRVCRILEIKEHRLENLPICRREIEKYQESQEEYWAREVGWAISCVGKRGEELSWAHIRNLTNIKKQNLIRCLPYLEKYTDVKVEQLIQNNI